MLLINSNNKKFVLNDNGNLEQEISNSEYNKIFYFFCGFNQKVEKYIEKFKNILIKNNFFKLKISLFYLKEYVPDHTVKMFLSEKEMLKNDKILSYYKYLEKEKIKKPTEQYYPGKIVFDCELDFKILSVLEKDFYILKDWNKFTFLGFSMGGRYALHLIEMLNAKVFSAICCKSTVTHYLAGHSSFIDFYVKHKENFNLSGEEKNVEQNIEEVLLNDNTMKNVY